MKWMRIACVAVLAAVTMTGAAWAVEGQGPDTFQLKNRLRVEYDDNIYETKDDKTESWKIIEELELLLNLNFEQTG